MIEYYKYIDRYTVEPAPYPLSIDGEDIFTTDEEIYNSLDYYRIERQPYPSDTDFTYIAVYYPPILNAIHQEWVKEVEEQ